MVFSVGNVITLLVVLIILAIYRQLDKNNRSLEKVKRYSDKIKEELDLYVDEKTVEVKNYAIELEVHHKTGKEILSRIQSIENQMDSKAANIEAMYEKVNEYDSALEQLNTMTLKVQENLNRLHEESDFVDKVGRRIKESGNTVKTLEKSISEIKNEFAKENLKELKEIRSVVAKDTKDYVTRLHGEIKKSFERIHSLESMITSIEERKDELQSEAVSSIQQSLDEQIYRVQQNGEQLKKEFEDDLAAAVSSKSAEVDSLSNQLDSVLDSYRASFEEAAKRGASLEDEAFSAIKERISGTAESLKNDAAAQINKLKESLYTEFGTLKEDYSGFLQEAEQKFEAVNGKMEGLEQNVSSKFLEMEKKIAEYEEDLTYRYGRIEEIGKDIDSLEGNLRNAMDTTAARIESDFAEYEKTLDKEREDYRAKAGAQLAEINAGLSSLESDLNNLKQRAYDNVSEKLKLFEDDFFSSLQTRSAAMEEKLVEWKSGIDQIMENLALEGQNERGEIEKKYADELRMRFEEFKTKIYQDHDKFEDKVNAFQLSIEERLKASDASIETTANEIRKDILDVKESSVGMFNREFTEYRTNVDSEIKKAARESENQLKSLEELLEVREKEILAALESTQSDVTVWQTKVLQQFQAAESEMHTHYSDLEKEVLDNISQIKSEFESQRDDLIISSQEERTRLKNELKEIGDGVVNLEGELRKRTEDAFEKFGREFENFYFEIQKKNREMQSELEKRIKEFRTISQDTKEKTEQLQKKLFGKIEENYQVLSVNLQEIDKRQKNFIAQTKIFTRADSLKVNLQESIEDLKVELSRVEAQENGIREAERKFAAIKKLGDEVSAKLGRFMAEKRRIEEMEGDFKKLIIISQAVDQKLNQVTSAHDDLQAIQIKIKSIEDLEKEVEARYERLEKKNRIIDATTDSVDKNFQLVEDLEGQVRSLKDVVATIPDQIHTVANRIEPLARDKKKADDAVEKLKALDKLLEDIEKRTDNMQKAREWLARTETRLEEINKQAQEQVKLLGSILKEGGKATGGDKGAPPMAARDVVIRLAHQGWSVKEIASATKLSRGEVELILELLPGKK